MSDMGWFAVAFVGFFVLRFIAATVFFLWLLPDGDRCLNCDAPTVRMESRGLYRTLPWFRPSWCLRCGWHGLLRADRAGFAGKHNDKRPNEPSRR